MLTRINGAMPDVKIPIGAASFPAPFGGGLEYASPARGTWNIVHTGMLLPQAHEIFVCGASCLRGVVLTAAEMGCGHRFSTVEIKEPDLYDGTLEPRIIEGVTEILEEMEQLPPAVLLYTNCIHHFAGCDLGMVYRRLREKFPTVDFTDCYMDPIMRKSGLTPDQKMRRQLYSLLKPSEKEEKFAAILGSDLETDKSCELFRLLHAAGFTVTEIHDCKTYEEYQAMAKASLYLTHYPPSKAAGEATARRLGGLHLHLPVRFGYEAIDASLQILADALGIPMPDLSAEKQACEAALKETAELVGDTPIAIDYSACPAPLGLARLLAKHGMNVKRVCADSFGTDEQGDFEWLKENCPNLELWPVTHPGMRFAAAPMTNEFLAIGQKAAHFCGTNHFVNLVQGGGFWGYSGILKLCGLMKEAFREEKNMRDLVTIKGWGCDCCL